MIILSPSTKLAVFLPPIKAGAMTIDISSFLYEELKSVKKKLEYALKTGDTATAAKLAKRMSELLKEMAKSKWNSLSEDKIVRITAIINEK